MTEILSRIQALAFDAGCSKHTPLINVMPSETEIIRLEKLFLPQNVCVCLRARIIKIFQSPALALRWTLWAFAPVLLFWSALTFCNSWGLTFPRPCLKPKWIYSRRAAGCVLSFLLHKRMCRCTFLANQYKWWLYMTENFQRGLESMTTDVKLCKKWIKYSSTWSEFE